MWKALQQHRFMPSLPAPTTYADECTSFEVVPFTDSPTPLAFSNVYYPLPSYKTQYIRKWEQALGVTFSDVEADQIIHCSATSSVCSRNQVISFYPIGIGLPRSSVASNRMLPTCAGGVGQLESPLHIFWACPVLSSFWA